MNTSYEKQSHIKVTKCLVLGRNKGEEIMLEVYEMMIRDYIFYPVRTSLTFLLKF